MFHFDESDYGHYRRYRFHHPELGHGFAVVPAAGANVTALEFSGTSVLDGHETPDELRAGKWGKSAILFPFLPPGSGSTIGLGSVKARRLCLHAITGNAPRAIIEPAQTKTCLNGSS